MFHWKQEWPEVWMQPEGLAQEQKDLAAEPGQKKTDGTGADVVLWAEVTGAAGKEGVLITVGFGVDG